MRGKNSLIKEYEDVHAVDFAPYFSTHKWGLLLRGVHTVVNLKQPFFSFFLGDPVDIVTCMYLGRPTMT